MKSILLLVLLVVLPAAFAATTREIRSPAGAGAMGSSLATAPDGTVYLSWLEPAENGEWALQFSRFDRSTESWSAAREIARGANWFVNWADFPSVTPLSDAILFAVWFENNPPDEHDHAAGHHGPGYHARYSLSDDRGQTWSAAQAITGESRVTEFAAVLPLQANARALIAWLDGRARTGERGVQKLYAQTLLADGPDALVDPSVCDCCQLSLVLIGEDALLAYRGRTDAEVRDIRLARWRGAKWETPRNLHDDGWEISACPVNGPRLATNGRVVAAVWFTGAQGNARVLAKISPDGGENFGEPLRLDLGRPQGRVDAVMFADGSTVFTWLEMTGRENGREGGIFLRRLGADGRLGEPQLVASSTTARAGGFPRVVQLDDSRLLLTSTVEGAESRVATLLIDLK